MRMIISEIPRAALNIVFPSYCQGCKANLPYDDTLFLCKNCIEKLRLDTNSTYTSGDENSYFDKAYHCCHYNGLIKELIHRFKYNKKIFIRHALTDLLYELFTLNIASSNIDLITAVPMHPVDERKRGFNQSYILAKGLSEKTGIEFINDAVIKYRRTGEQVRLKRNRRIENTKNAFTVKKGLDLKGRRILIVDDVFTTGATINECAKALNLYNTDRIYALTLAKGV
jgi:competence protein ComFC